MLLRAYLCLIVLMSLFSSFITTHAKESLSSPSGALTIVDQDGKRSQACPLEHTDVDADIAGFVSRVRVRQIFQNPLLQKIEAVYVFPLPHQAAVDEMTMTIGDRRVVGRVKPRDDAQQQYEAARDAGYAASLLEQERPNIFIQSITNVEPGARIVIEISYVETLKYEDGSFAFVFPMVVGPRYIPGAPTDQVGLGWAQDTTQVPDASRITPPVARPSTRAGHDLSLTVRLDAGLPLVDLASELHEVEVERPGTSKAIVTLKNRQEIPNRDFILHYRIATTEIGDGVLVHTDKRGAFFTLILQPPQRVLPSHAMPKEMLFVLDRSGSMSGFPLDKVKETTRLAIERLNPNDTFNLFSFSDKTDRLFRKAARNIPENRAAALQYLDTLDSSGGTEMLPALQETLDSPADPARVRILCFLTDGYVGNDLEIIAAVRKHAANARVFALGIGNAVNRFLLDGVAHAGRGAAHYVTLESQAQEIVLQFVERIDAPMLTDIMVNWGDLPVSNIHPQQIPDLFSDQPLMIYGRLNGPIMGTVTLRGRTAVGPFEREISLAETAQSSSHSALPSLWARAKVEDLLAQDYAALQRGIFPETLRKEITTLATEFRLLSPFTSFVAVEEMIVTVAGEPTKIIVPVEIPQGVSYEDVFGKTPNGVGLPGLFQTYMAKKGAQQLTSSTARLATAIASLSGSAASASRELLDEDPSSTYENTVTALKKLDPTVVLKRKLAEPLQGLLEKVVHEGKEGNLVINNLKVTDYKVDVMIHLHKITTETLIALQKLSFVQTGESKMARLLIGVIDVRQLEALATLDEVARITPVVGEGKG